ncbi:MULTISPECIES: hypothetical protein [Bacillus cereus group]|uniref:hypothetical protein n=1 Tax=Bacillus cereus group TaxID=86661 RepID=UPI0022E75316|nr:MULTISPECIES: hypothetical protein [Bacillus cereus group]MDA2771328.1 hypothetical protein [Bacillus cereus group sp. Bc010]MED0988418.1 hypothetical protein [Bacillus nitratireducens]MED1511841.1 hypothetical protein [Bacillus proteolyticus]
MGFLQEAEMLIYSSQKYEEIYMKINKDLKITYKNIFLLCAALGARNGRTTPVTKRGREFRASYFNESEENLVYTIILNDETNGKNIELFNDPEFRKEARKIIEEYAEGGMDILVEEVFKEKWNGIKLDEKYDNYDVDIMKYLIANLNKVPF